MKKIALGIIIGLLFTILVNASSVLGDFESALAQKLLGRSGRVGDVETPINGNIWNEQRTVMIGTDRFAAVHTFDNGEFTRAFLNHPGDAVDILSAVFA